MRAQLTALIFVLTTIACGSKKDSTTGEAAKTTTSTGGSGATASREAQDKATEAEQARGNAKTEADNAKEAADAEAAKTHKLASDHLQSDFDASDRRFNALEEKAAKATGAKKQKANAAVAEVTKREATVMASIAKLRDATGAQWDTTNTQVQADAAALDKSIDALEVTLH
jgi:hypothetical protein